jgi:hypothetical protein
MQAPKFGYLIEARRMARFSRFLFLLFCLASWDVPVSTIARDQHAAVRRRRFWPASRAARNDSELPARSLRRRRGL